MKPACAHSDNKSRGCVSQFKCRGCSWKRPMLVHALDLSFQLEGAAMWGAHHTLWLHSRPGSLGVTPVWALSLQGHKCLYNCAVSAPSQMTVTWHSSQEPPTIERGNRRLERGDIGAGGGSFRGDKLPPWELFWKCWKEHEASRGSRVCWGLGET